MVTVVMGVIKAAVMAGCLTNYDTNLLKSVLMVGLHWVVTRDIFT